ncbi:hypothetical protein EVAR_38029_1 [Eumeta japonica]|uniref:Uncharacterized protein n=1 Tax=Eumeta variegata TaxID=151549 RepID=A0A4C1WAU9_EUMVA|nr:hypothetical protein EVAR_38029_1 [Eumeta japonica]
MKAYRTTSTAALLFLAGVLPADLDMTLAGRVDLERDNLIRAEVRTLSWRADCRCNKWIRSSMLISWVLGGTSAGLENLRVLGTDWAADCSEDSRRKRTARQRTGLWRHKPY